MGLLTQFTSGIKRVFKYYFLGVECVYCFNQFLISDSKFLLIVKLLTVSYNLILFVWSLCQSLTNGKANERIVKYANRPLDYVLFLIKLLHIFVWSNLATYRVNQIVGAGASVISEAIKITPEVAQTLRNIKALYSLETTSNG